MGSIETHLEKHLAFKIGFLKKQMLQAPEVYCNMKGTPNYGSWMVQMIFPFHFGVMALASKLVWRFFPTRDFDSGERCVFHMYYTPRKLGKYLRCSPKFDQNILLDGWGDQPPTSSSS